MNHIINAKGIISESLEGPLARHLGPYAEHIRGLGYTLGSLNKQIRIVARFSAWLGRRTVPLQDVSSEHAARFLRYRARQVRIDKGDAPALRRLMDFLHEQGAIPTQRTASETTEAQHHAQAYEQYLRDVRGLAKATIVGYVPFIRDFLKDRFGDGPVNLSRLRASDVVRFVQCEAPGSPSGRAKSMTKALRSYLRYARYCAEGTPDLAAAVPVVANWSMSSIPRAIAADQVRQLLASIDRRAARGRRDYAILLLFARLGLRSGEVALLELDDIDWNAARLSISGKSGRRVLPLSSEVGEAIATYLRRGRPSGTSRRVFLTVKAPIRGLRGSTSVGWIVRDAINRAGVKAPTRGAHQFRHGLATHMLARGASLGEIGEVLGHHCPQTTMIYTKVDLQALRALALPWPGGVR